MRKFAANYLVSENGTFLKNGIVTAGENGIAVEYTDTKGNLEEIARLVFHNGILIPAFALNRTSIETPVPEPEYPVRRLVVQLVAGQTLISAGELLELGKQVQHRFPEMTIPEIFREITDVLLSGAWFSKQNIAGIFLLTGADLAALHFTPKCRLKKIL